MPPVPTPLISALPIWASEISSNDFTSDISFELTSPGGAVINPSTSEIRTKASALIKCVTIPAKRSLSPTRISSVATVSFSLTIGITPNSNNLAKVR